MELEDSKLTSSHRPNKIITTYKATISEDTLQKRFSTAKDIKKKTEEER